MRILGIDFDGSLINIALLSKKKEILDLNSFEFSNVKQLYMDKALASKSLLTITGLDANKVIIKHKTLKMTKKKAIEKALPFQTEIASSLNKEKSLVFPIIAKKHAGACDLLFFITTKKALQDHINSLSEIDLDPDIVSSKVNGLIRFAKYHFPDKNELCLLHVGNTQTTVVHMENSLAKASYFINVGTENLLKDQNSAGLDFSKISINQSSNSQKVFLNELSRALYSFFEKNKIKKVPFLITGQVSSLKNFNDSILSKFSNYFTESLEIDKPMQLPFAISVGLALEARNEDQLSVQFRQNEFIPLKHLKQIGKSLLLFLVGTLVLSSLIFFYGNKFVSAKNEILTKNISLLEKNEKLHLSSLPPESLQHTLNSYEKKIEKETKEFPYFVNFPKMSSIITWINSHPKLKPKKNEYVDLNNISYELIESKKEGCSTFLDAKVILELTASSSLAQNFHDSLSKSEMIDSAKEITWEKDKNRYKTSFYLKKVDPYDE